MKTRILDLFDPSNGHVIMQAIGLAIAAASSYLMPIGEFVIAIGALVMIDLYTGWRKSKKEGTKLNSKGVARTIDKSLTYLVLMLVSRIIDHLFGLGGTLSCTYGIGGLIVGRELLSILENSDAIEGTDFAERMLGMFPFLTRPKRKKKTDVDL